MFTVNKNPTQRELHKFGWAMLLLAYRIASLNSARSQANWIAVGAATAPQGINHLLSKQLVRLRNVVLAFDKAVKDRLPRQQVACRIPMRVLCMIQSSSFISPNTDAKSQYGMSLVQRN